MRFAGGMLLFFGALLMVRTVPGEASFFDHDRYFLAMRDLGNAKCDPPAAKVIARFFREKNPGLSRDTAKKYADLVVFYSGKYGVDPFLVGGMIIKESTARAKAYSRGCYGLMQIKWSVHRKTLPRKFPWIQSAKDLYKPQNNIEVGVSMVANFLKMHGGKVDKSLNSYKGSASARYKKTILKYYHRMMILYNKARSS